VIRRSLNLAAALLAAFHAWIFLSQAWTGELVDLALVTRWVIAAGLFAALLHLRRRGLSVVQGRHAIAVWLLAALLHGPALAQNINDVAPPMPEVVATLAQVVSSVATLGTILLILFSLRTKRAQISLRPAARPDAPIFVGALPPRSFLRFAPRPPPGFDSSIRR
jgi:hypothetical protein